jgi:hypothetical protein
MLGVTLEGDNPDDFTMTAIRPENTLEVVPTGSLEIDVQLTPLTPGFKQARLVIAYEGGTEFVDLVGAAFVPPVATRSYYSCDSCATGGEPSPWWLLMVLWLLRVCYTKRSDGQGQGRQGQDRDRSDARG